MQFADGGTINNLPIAYAGNPKTEKQMLLMLPTYWQTPPDETGAPGYALDTIDFSGHNLGPVDDYNRERFGEYGQRINELLEESHQSGVDRVVLAFNLTPADGQKTPVIQGSTRDATLSLHRAADRAEFPHLSARDGVEVVDEAFNKVGLKGRVIKYIYDWIIGDDRKDPDLFHPGDGEKPPLLASHEMRDPLQSLKSVIASIFRSRELWKNNRFERQEE